VNIERLSNNNPYLGSVYSRKKATFKNDVLAKKAKVLLVLMQKKTFIECKKKAFKRKTYMFCISICLFFFLTK